MSDSSDKEFFVLVGTNSSLQVQVFGTRTGKPFVSEKSAEKHAKKMEKQYPHLDILIMPVSMFPDKEAG